MTPRDPKEAADDSRKCHALAIAAMRELCIRRQQILPSPDNLDEQRWAAEGEIDVRQLHTVRTGAVRMTDHPLSVDISFLLPPDGGLGEANSPRGAAGDEMRHMGRVAGSALSQSNVIALGPFLAGLDVLMPAHERGNFIRKTLTDNAAFSGLEQGENIGGRRHG